MHIRNRGCPKSTASCRARCGDWLHGPGQPSAGGHNRQRNLPLNLLPYNWSARGYWHTNSNRLAGNPRGGRIFAGVLPLERRSAPSRRIALRSSAPRTGESGSRHAWRGQRHTAHRVGRRTDKVRERGLQRWPTTKMSV